MNVKLLRKVKKHILEEPRRFVMHVWRTKDGSNDWADYGDGTYQADTDAEGNERPPVRYAKCGTAACIAGWSVILNKETRLRNIKVRAAKILGLNAKESDRLFLQAAWPVKFNERYSQASTTRTRAKIAAERIEHFISTKGAE